MKRLIISRSVLKQALKKIGLAIPKKSVLPVLQCIHCSVKDKEVTFITTDLEVTIQYTCACEAKSEFVFLAPFEFLHKIIELSEDAPITIDVADKSITLKTDNDIFTTGLSSTLDTFPKIPSLPQKNSIQLPEDFIYWINKATVTIGTDEQRPAMMHVCLDIAAGILKIVSTNTHVLFIKGFNSIDPEIKEQLLISSKVARTLEGAEELSISWTAKHIGFKWKNIVVISTRREDKFPNYNAVIPQSPANLTLERKALINVFEKCALTSLASKDTSIHLNQPGEIHFEANDPDFETVIKSRLIAEYSGEVEKIKVNAKKFNTLLEQVEFEKVDLHISGPAKGIVITSEEDTDYLSLIMPLTAQ